MKNHSSTSLLKADFLRVSELHKIYYEIHGNPIGIPVFIVHGGPGGGSSFKLKELFNLTKFKLIFFDQRGCGKSQPFLELKDNNTNELVEDIEKLRKYLNLGQINLFGGSWGTTLSLMYAIKYPKNVAKILLRAVFLARQEDVNFLYEKNGASEFYPDLFEKYYGLIKNEKGNSILEKYYKIFISKSSALQKEAAIMFSNWENSLVSIKKFNAKKRYSKTDINDALAISLLESHYFINQSFLPYDNYILDNVNILLNHDVTIIHGRQDIDCRPIGAYLLHKKLPNSKLFLIDAAGHTSLDKNLWNQLKKSISDWEK
ncbi:prolyl aminopeptidase [Mycoplasmopsis cynos]|uniref:Proline iminopeptidase n=2 Tax=Mycoplasmopsis cynos TaxID=171284 RepID=A0A449AJ54_9BACT|nr:prolyl aminopeptidase [Mycoplasmopsis cynos]VEU65054.1 Proline iminopeptidase [Mycoplasmopsis cynos]